MREFLLFFKTLVLRDHITVRARVNSFILRVRIQNANLKFVTVDILDFLQFHRVDQPLYRDVGRGGAGDRVTT